MTSLAHVTASVRPAAEAPEHVRMRALPDLEDRYETQWRVGDTRVLTLRSCLNMLFIRRFLSGSFFLGSLIILSRERPSPALSTTNPHPRKQQ